MQQQIADAKNTIKVNELLGPLLQSVAISRN